MSFAERRRFLLILFLAGLLLIALAASATTFARLPFRELAREAAAIARMRCISSESRWAQGEIWTDTRFEVLETEKGRLPHFVMVRTPGGRTRELESRVDGAPRFRAGEEAYLFLRGQPGEPYRVLGWAQGTFRIAKNPATLREMVTQDSAATMVFDPERREFHAEGFRNVSVTEFRERLRRAIEETR